MKGMIIAVTLTVASCGGVNNYTHKISIKDSAVITSVFRTRYHAQWIDSLMEHYLTHTSDSGIRQLMQHRASVFYAVDKQDSNKRFSIQVGISEKATGGTAHTETYEWLELDSATRRLYLYVDSDAMYRRVW